MREKRKEIKWEIADFPHDLKVQHPLDVPIERLKFLLENVVRPKADYKKNFSRKATEIFRKWLDSHCCEPLPEEAYAILSNWFLGKGGYKKKQTATAAKMLWEELFCAKPKTRLTDWKKNGSQIVKDRFDSWWTEQQKCQDDFL